MNNCVKFLSRLMGSLVTSGTLPLAGSPALVQGRQDLCILGRLSSKRTYLIGLDLGQGKFSKMIRMSEQRVGSEWKRGLLRGRESGA